MGLAAASASASEARFTKTSSSDVAATPAEEMCSVSLASSSSSRMAPKATVLSRGRFTITAVLEDSSIAAAGTCF